jgi:hypothetical protein
MEQAMTGNTMATEQKRSEFKNKYVDIGIEIGRSEIIDSMQYTDRQRRNEDRERHNKDMEGHAEWEADWRDHVRLVNICYVVSTAALVGIAMILLFR